MVENPLHKTRIASGVSQLDRLLGGIFIGDNVVWYDDAGSLASVFCLNFIRESTSREKPLIYVSFDRSPRNLLEKLGPLAESEHFTLLDCFTYGKGAGSDVFSNFYEENPSDWPCRIICVDEPWEVDKVADSFYGIHSELDGDVRFVFESLTGMQELWGSEDHIIRFYAHSCPRLYELNTIAYWILEKKAHSTRLRAQINQIAQVAIDLSVKRGTTSLTILKAEERSLENFNKPHRYWVKDLTVSFETEKHTTGQIDLGTRLKELRMKRGLSQTELAKLVGVTPSTISQVESRLIYPSLPALLKMAEVLSVEIGTFFQGASDVKRKVVFPASGAVDIKFPELPADSVFAKLLAPLDFDGKAEPYLIEIPPKKTLPAHFFIHKGQEMGYVLSGKLHLNVGKESYSARSGDVIYLTADMPNQWKNPGPGAAKLLWVKIN